MAKRSKLTRTRADAVDSFVKALREECAHVDNCILLDKFVADYKSGAQLVQGNYAKPLAYSKPRFKKKTPWWKYLLGVHD